jgi:hypothetical protein
MSVYDYALGAEAVHVFASLPPRQRSRLIRLFVHLTRHPSQPGDYQETGASGRIYELKLVDDMLVTWWTDHAEREVRIIRLERVD